jgi:hypothetical protein
MSSMEVYDEYFDGVIFVILREYFVGFLTYLKVIMRNLS